MIVCDKVWVWFWLLVSSPVMNHFSVGETPGGICGNLVPFGGSVFRERESLEKASPNAYSSKYSTYQSSLFWGGMSWTPTRMRGSGEQRLCSSFPKHECGRHICTHPIEAAILSVRDSCSQVITELWVHFMEEIPELLSDYYTFRKRTMRFGIMLFNLNNYFSLFPFLNQNKIWK